MPRQSYSGKKGRSPFVALYVQEGENAAYASYTNTSVVMVNAALTKPLQWLYTPPFDVWAEVEFFIGLTQKLDAAYHYSQLNMICTPAPVAGVGGQVTQGSDAHMMHSQVQTYGRHIMRKLYALAGGTAYTMNANFGTSGGTWSYYQSPAHLWMTGKAWPR